MDKLEPPLLACLPAIGSSLALALLLFAGCAIGIERRRHVQRRSDQLRNECFDLNSTAQHAQLRHSCSTGQNCVAGSCQSRAATPCAARPAPCWARTRPLRQLHQRLHRQPGVQHGSCSSTGCGGGQTACSGKLLDLKSNVSNCNACGAACALARSAPTASAAARRRSCARRSAPRACSGGGQAARRAAARAARRARPGRRDRRRHGGRGTGGNGSTGTAGMSGVRPASAGRLLRDIGHPERGTGARGPVSTRGEGAQPDDESRRWTSPTCPSVGAIT